MRWLIVFAVVAGCGDNVPVSAPDAAPDADEPPPSPVFSQTAYIKSTQTIHDAHFSKFALSGAADTLVAAQLGTVSVYTHDATWHVAGEITPSTPSLEFGTRVAISSDGSTIAVGGSEADAGHNVIGAVYVFRRVGTAWIQDARIDDVDDNGAPVFYDEFPASLALSSDGNTLVVGSRDTTSDIGRVRTYDRGQSTWSQVASLGGGSNDSHFGLSLALAPDGSALATSVYRQGANDETVEVFVRTGSTWMRRATLASPDQHPWAGFGTSISCSARCETIAIGTIEVEPPPSLPGMRGAGVAYVFAGDGTTWTPTGTLAAKNADIGDKFGTAVAVAGDGSTIVVGAPSESSAATGIDGDGANNAAPYAGAAYVFRRHRGTWTQVMYLKASNTEQLDIFGTVVGVADDGTTIAVAAMYEPSASSGVGGDQTDNSQPYAGAIYAFEGTY